MNIGDRPTVNGEHQTIEVNIFDFETTIYNKIITIELLEFIREEQKFDSLEALKNQLNTDKETALKFISKL
jgi:riboflavin kinase/FMN adenylyltransferase